MANADLFRYLLIYATGGVNFDLKTSIRDSLTRTLQPSDRYLLSHRRNWSGQEFERCGLWDELCDFENGEFQQWHIVAVRGHPFLRAILEKLLSNLALYSPILHGTARRGVLRTTGPFAYI